MALDLKFDFNDPLVLQAYMNQALPQVGLVYDDTKERLLIGSRGGLCYRLFPEDIGEVPTDLSGRGIDAMRDILRKTAQYVRTAEKIAAKHNLDMIHIPKDKWLTYAQKATSDARIMAIGKSKVNSVEDLTRILSMVKEEEDRLYSYYYVVSNAMGFIFDPTKEHAGGIVTG